MKFLLALAWKNLSRHRKRTIITAIAIATGIAMYIWVDSMLLGLEKESERNLVWYETASAKIMEKDFWKNIDYLPLKNSFIPEKDLIGAVEDSGFTWTPRISFLVEMYDSEGSLPVKMIGIDPKRDESVFRLKETLSRGKYLEKGKDEVLIGKNLARDLHVDVGDVVIVKTRSRLGAFQTMDLLVTGIMDCPNPQINNGVAFIPIDVANRALRMEGRVTEMALHFPEWKSPEKKVAELQRKLSGMQGTESPGGKNLVVESWRELGKDYVAIAEGKRGATKIILFLIFIIAAVGISNTMLMALYERMGEIGMMRAMGMNDREVKLSFLLEAGGIGFIGSLIGIALGAVLSFYMVNYGIDFTGMIGDMDVGYRTSGLMRGAWDLKVFVVAFVFGIVASMLVALVPTSRALKMEITECLRSEL